LPTGTIAQPLIFAFGFLESLEAKRQHGDLNGARNVPKCLLMTHGILFVASYNKYAGDY